MGHATGTYKKGGWICSFADSLQQAVLKSPTILRALAHLKKDGTQNCYSQELKTSPAHFPAL